MTAAYRFAPPESAGNGPRDRDRSPRGAEGASSPDAGDEAIDRALIDRLRAGDARALRTLFERYYARLLPFAMRYVRDGEVARDVLQDVFAALWIRRDALAPRGVVAAYLYGAVRNEALGWRAHQEVTERWRVAERARDDARTASNAGADGIETREMAHAITRAIDALPPRTREVFLLSRNDGLSHREIADVLGTSPQTVANQMTRALQLLDRALREWR